MTNEATILCVMLVATCSGAQVPCGRTTLMSMTWQQLLRKAWRDVTRQIDITLRHHKRQDYDALYEQVQSVSSGGPGHIPIWIPGEGDVNSLKRATLTQHEAGIYLLKLHRDLQKFEIIMDEIGRGEGDSLTLKHMMVSTRAFLQQLQFEVKKALLDLQIGVPSPPKRHAIMIRHEPADRAGGMARDRGVLSRYRIYLRQWVRLWCADVGRRRRIRQRFRVSTATRKCEQEQML